MATIERSARVPYAAEQMLALVNDIDSYPVFLHWCHAARIESSEGTTVQAALEIGIRGIHKTIRTRNTTTLGETASTIRIEMIEGPLRHLAGAWTFADHAEGGSDVKLRVEYETHRTPFGAILRALFDEIANSQLHAFIRRAENVYGVD